MARILIAGCGYVGSALAERLIRESHSVWGLCRNPRALPPGVEPIAADLSDPESLNPLPERLDFIFYLASPSGSEDVHYRRGYVDGLRGLLGALEGQRQRPKRILFASSTAVYGQQAGEWVDENSITEPTHFRGTRLLEAEQIILSAPVPAIVVRFGGIYGPRRTRLIDQVRAGRAVYHEKPPQYSNRIHRDDCAGSLHHLMKLSNRKRIYLAVDSDPADDRTVLRWLAGALGSPEPRAAGSADHGVEQRRGNKRARNDQLIRSGYTFQYPTFREGYRAVIEDIA